MPRAVITAKSAPYLRHGRPAALNALQNLHDHDIVETYGAQYRGIVQYYLLAGDVYRLNRLRWVMESSLLKTLAARHGSSMSAMAARYKTAISTPHGPRTCFEAVRQREGNRKPLVARFGGIPLKRQKYAVISDRIPGQNPSPLQRADHPAPAETVRTVREQRPGASAPHRQTRRTGTTRPWPAPVGETHGEDATQVPRALRAMPRLHPHRAAISRHPSHDIGH